MNNSQKKLKIYRLKYIKYKLLNSKLKMKIYYYPMKNKLKKWFNMNQGQSIGIK
jgi:hypothetical protein